MKKRKHLMMKCIDCGEIFWWDAAFYGAQCLKCGGLHPAYTGVSRLTPVVGDAASPPDSGEQTRTSGQASEGSAPHPLRA